jgi:hypothetical protein
MKSCNDENGFVILDNDVKKVEMDLNKFCGTKKEYNYNENTFYCCKDPVYQSVSFFQKKTV